MTKSKSEKSHKDWMENMQKTIAGIESIPFKAKMKELEEEFEGQEQERRQQNKRKIILESFFFFAMVFLIPVLILLWNVHPVLGILGIVFYVWLVRNKIQTGYYFG
ncbi:MAG: hypothetical protein HYV67_00755 [Candidatus Taylorbacteria bacterium]|nr:hypothetical protein [Candidatus Taylorbacteria bacterium]